MEVESISIDEWASERSSSEVSVFHRPETLRVIDRHVSGDIDIFAGYNGDRLVGVFPVNTRNNAVGSIVTSPPPGLGLPHQGPILLPASPKQRKREKLNQTFTAAVLERLSTESSFSLLRAICLPEHTDPRPFQWEGLDVETRFTYRLDVGDRTADEVKQGFSRSLRREIGAATEEPITVDTEGIDGARLIYEDCAERYAEQDRTYSLTWSFVRDLLVSLGDHTRVFVSRGPDDEYLGGIIVIYSDTTAYFWQGGVRHTFGDATTNSFLHWEIISDLLENPEYEHITQYDLFGANTARLCEYKSKFGGQLVPYYVVESAGPGMTVAKSAYGLVGRLGTLAENEWSNRTASESD
ncbi:GNAT family N-acetyltransferase [Halomarina rubra]|uniref:GNAT family N-acetyltransferase n=1 Tax=Halomarina rubra TaxID=2071873 RepID=A0ABD6AXJ4_9EURY|nr:GNAT family N-acetyltransferase [Halomarina rubra]